MTTPRIALTTAARLPDGVEDTGPLMAALDWAGCRGEPVIWSDPTVYWGDYDLVVLHSPWDYTDDVAAFLDWVDEAAKASKLVNPASLVRWNADKSYLLDLAGRGLPLAPSLGFDRGSDVSIAVLEERFGQRDDLVLKPRVGAGGRRVHRLPTARDVVTLATTAMRDEPCLVQAFQPAVLSSGELSAVCTGGEVSHVVRKEVGGSEFRIHERYGGTTTAVPTEPWMAAFVHDVLAGLPAPAPVARVDFTVEDDGLPVLMEVEVIEPDLFLRTSASGLARVADVLARSAKPA